MLTLLCLIPQTPVQAFVVVGDYNGHCGLGVKCAKEVATAIRGAQSCWCLELLVFVVAIWSCWHHSSARAPSCWPACVLLHCSHLLSCPLAAAGAIILAKMATVPVRRGYWGNKIGKVHTVPTKVTGECGSVTVRLIPAPRGEQQRSRATTGWPVHWEGMHPAVCTAGLASGLSAFNRAGESGSAPALQPAVAGRCQPRGSPRLATERCCFPEAAGR